MNNHDLTIEELEKRPIELFGLPDPLPLFSIFCKGNVNNLRLFNYGDQFCKKQVLFAYYYAQENQDLSNLFENEEFENYLFSFKFQYDKNNRLLNILRKKIIMV